MIGRRLGRFLVSGKIGQGGMATVWRAEDELLGRTVALKVLAETLAGEPEARRRFLREARAAALLNHPGIATVYDAGETGELVWLAMAYIDGETVGERAARRLMPCEEAVRIVRDAAEALGHAHARGVVHRDISSRNIMIARDGRVFVLDFGLALVHGESRVTTSGTTLGTLSYLSPEVAVGRTADSRSDLYGLGVVLYEALTGALPFEGDRPESLVYSIVHEAPVPPGARRPELPEALQRIVMRAIARRPVDRYATAEDLVADLAALGPIPEAEVAPWPAPRPDLGQRPTEPLPGRAKAREAPPTDADAPAPRRGPVYLAVLPFEDIDTTGEPDGRGEVFARGLGEAVAASLGRIPRVHVIPPSGATAEIARSEPSIIARQLGANLVLRGGVRSSGAQLRIAWSLVDPRDGLQVAGDTVDGSALEVFDLENRVVAGLARALGADESLAQEHSRPRPRDPAAHERYLQALGYLKRDDVEATVDAAIAILQQLAESDAGLARVHAALGRACLAKFRITKDRRSEEQAASACERALELDADDPEVLVTRGELRTAVGRSEEALSDFRRALQLQPGHIEALLGLARASVGHGETAEAERAAREAIRQHPRDWRAYSMLGFVYFREGEYARALAPWRRVVRLSPENVKGLRNLGTIYLQLDRLEDAARTYRGALERQPDAITYYNLGTVLFYLGRFEESVSAFGKATALAPTNPASWGNLGSALHYMPGREEEARPHLQRGIAMMRDHLGRNPGDADGWQRLAGWLGNLGRRDEAEEAIGRALALAPQDHTVLASAAGLCGQLGDRQRALRFVAEAVRHGSPAALLRRSQDLESLRGDPEFERSLEGPGAGPAGSAVTTERGETR